MHNTIIDSVYKAIYIFTAVAVSFNQSTYRVDENIGEMQIVLVFNKPSSTDITVMIRDAIFNATSKLYFCYTCIP